MKQRNGSDLSDYDPDSERRPISLFGAAIYGFMVVVFLLAIYGVVIAIRNA